MDRVNKILLTLVIICLIIISISYLSWMGDVYEKEKISCEEIKGIYDIDEGCLIKKNGFYKKVIVKEVNGKNLLIEE